MKKLVSFFICFFICCNIAYAYTTDNVIGWSAGNNPKNVLDGSTGSYSTGWYCSNVPTGWLKFDLQENFNMTGIKIWSYYNSGYEGICDFKIEGSNSGNFSGEEILIYTDKHENDTTNNFITYNFDNLNTYRYYKFSVLSLYVGNGGNNLFISELDFVGDVIEPTPTPTPTPIEPTPTPTPIPTQPPVQYEDYIDYPSIEISENSVDGEFLEAILIAQIDNSNLIIDVSNNLKDLFKYFNVIIYFLSGICAILIVIIFVNVFMRL